MGRLKGASLTVTNIVEQTSDENEEAQQV